MYHSACWSSSLSSTPSKAHLMPLLVSQRCSCYTIYRIILTPPKLWLNLPIESGIKRIFPVDRSSFARRLAELRCHVRSFWTFVVDILPGRKIALESIGRGVSVPTSAAVAVGKHYPMSPHCCFHVIYGWDLGVSTPLFPSRFQMARLRRRLSNHLMGREQVFFLPRSWASTLTDCPDSCIIDLK